VNYNFNIKYSTVYLLRTPTFLSPLLNLLLSHSQIRQTMLNKLLQKTKQQMHLLRLYVHLF